MTTNVNFRFSYLFGITTIIYQVIRLLLNVYVAKKLGPIEYAPWNIIQPTLFFGAILLLGIASGVNREVPYYLGRGNEKKANELIQVGFGFIVIVLIPLFVIIELLVLLIIERNNTAFLVISLIFIWQIYVYTQACLRGFSKFDIYSKQQILYIVLIVISTVSFIKFGLNGILLANIITTLFCILLNLISIPGISYPIYIKFNVLYDMVRKGLPIMLLGILYYFILNVDKYIVNHLLSKNDLGLYTIVSLAGTGTLLISSIIDQQFYPKLTFEFGKNKCFGDVIPIFRKHAFVATILALSIVIVSELFIGYFIKHILPQYNDGIFAARIILIGMLPLAMSGALGAVFNAVGKQNSYLKIQCISATLTTVIIIIFGKLGKSIELISLGSIFAYFVHMALMIWLYYKVKNEWISK